MPHGGGAADMDMAAMVADVVPEIVLVVGGILVLLFAVLAPRRWQSGAALLALVVVALAAVVSGAMLGGNDTLTFADTYARDGVAIWSKLIVLAGTAGVIGLSIRWFRSDPRHAE